MTYYILNLNGIDQWPAYTDHNYAFQKAQHTQLNCGDTLIIVETDLNKADHWVSKATDIIYKRESHFREPEIDSTYIW